MTYENSKKLTIKIFRQSILCAYCILVWLLSGAGYFWPAWVILAAIANIAMHAYELGFWCEERLTEACCSFIQTCHDKYRSHECTGCKSSTCADPDQAETATSEHANAGHDNTHKDTK